MNEISPKIHDWFRGYCHRSGGRTRYSLVWLSPYLYIPLFDCHSDPIGIVRRLYRCCIHTSTIWRVPSELSCSSCEPGNVLLGRTTDSSVHKTPLRIKTHALGPCVLFLKVSLA